MKYIRTLLILFFFSLSALAQKVPAQLYGSVIDAFTGKAISEEIVCSLLRSDSSVIMTTKSYEHTDRGNGTLRTCFGFDVPEQASGDLLVKLEAKGYETVYKSVKLVWKSKVVKISLWNVSMRRRSQPKTDNQLGKDNQLGEVTVKATKIKFYTKGDTLIYNADAFQLQEGSMLDALIAQLPGAELKPDGRIMVNGKFVESLLLNGRDFFKGDNTVLLDNLPAYMVQQVQVYTKESDMSKLVGKKVDDGRYVMDVKLKRQYSIGWLANTEWGYGTEDRYLGRLFAMRYTPHSRVTFFGNLNNVNDRRKPDGNGGWGDVDVTGGLTSTKRGGLDYSVFDKRERFDVSGNVDISYSDNDNIWGGSSTNFLSGGDVYNVTSSRTSSNNLSINTSHNVKFQFLKTRNAFSLSPNFSYQKSDYHRNFMNGTFDVLPAGDYTAVLDSLFSPDWTTTVRNLIRRNGEQAIGNSRTTNAGLSFWSYFKRPYSSDGFSVDGELSYSDRRQEGFNNFLYNYYEGNILQNDWRNRYNNSPQRNFDVSARAKYFWHWNEEIMLNPSYTFDHKYESGDRMHYRLDVLDESEGTNLGWLPSEAGLLLQALDTDNSYEGALHRYRHDFTFDWQWNRYNKNQQGRRLSAWSVNLTPSVVLEDNNFRFVDFAGGRNTQQIHKTYVLPNLRLYVKRNTKDYLHELTFTANAEAKSPSMTNLVDKTFAADPLNVTLGNPDLDQRTDVTLSFNYKSDRWLQNKGRQMYGNINWLYAANALSVSYVYDKETGVTTSRPVNLNGNWIGWFNFGYTTPLDKPRRLTLGTTTGGNCYHTVDFSGNNQTAVPLRNTTLTSVLNEELRLNYRYKKVNVGLKGNVAWNHASADRNDFSNANTWNIRYGANAVIDLPLAFQFSTELTMFTRRGYESDAMNRNDLVWNARLTKNFMKNRLCLMVDAWDILGNLSNVNVGMNSRSRWEYYTNVIPRYVMMRVVYRFDKQPKKKQ